VNKDLYLLQGICQIRKKNVFDPRFDKGKNDMLKVQKIPRYIRRRERISASGQSHLTFFAIFSNRIWRTL